jgi:hypothetical protein
MEPEGSLTCLQGISTGSYPEPDQSSSYHPILPLSKIHFNISHPPLSWSSYLYFPFGFPTNILYALLVPIRATYSAHLGSTVQLHAMEL